MKILDFLVSLTPFESTLFAIVTLLINVSATLISFTLVKRKYKKGNDVEQTLYFQSLLFKFVVLPLLMVSTFLCVFVIMPHLEKFGNYDFLVFFPVLMAYAATIGLMYVMVFHKFNKELRQTTVTAKSETKDFFKAFTISVLPFVIVMGLSKVLSKWVDSMGIDNMILDILITLSPILLIVFISPITIRLMLKPKNMEDGELKEKLSEYLSRNGIKNTTIYLLNTKDKKIANALVTGIMKKQIYITDYMLEHLTDDEVVGILAHEMWHIKKRHVPKRILMILAIVGWSLGCGFIFEWIENTFDFNINFFLGISVMLIPMLVFGTVGVRYLYRRQETEADLLSIEHGIDPQIFISALLKLAKLNDTVMKFNKVDEHFQTHPSYARRIKKIQDVYGERE